MPFTLCINRTVNGRERTLRWYGLPDADRAHTEETVEAFNAGRVSMEATWTISSGTRGPQDPDWARSWRWCDIKAIWIEEL